VRLFLQSYTLGQNWLAGFTAALSDSLFKLGCFEFRVVFFVTKDFRRAKSSKKHAISVLACALCNLLYFPCEKKKRTLSFCFVTIAEVGFVCYIKSTRFTSMRSRKILNRPENIFCFKRILTIGYFTRRAWKNFASHRTDCFT